jgi:hypothetical protein
MEQSMIDAHGIYLLVAAAAAVLALILLVAWAKLNPFLSILLVSLSLGVAARMPFPTILRSFETGLGNTLAHIAVVVALGTMLGKMMAESRSYCYRQSHHRLVRREASAMGHDGHRLSRRPSRLL